MRAVAAAVLVVATLPLQAGAECIVIEWADRMKAAAVVFSGRVANVQVLSGGRHIVDFEVERVWKGGVQPRTRLYYHVESINTVTFEPGRRYVVFAPTWGVIEFLDPRRQAVDEPRDSCGWGVPVEGPADDFDTALGRGRRP